MIIGGSLLWVRSAAGAAALFILAAIVWRIGGWTLLKMLLPIGVLLAVMIPPPGRQDQLLTLKLQQIAVAASSRLLDRLHVPHVRGGNVLEIPGRRLLVEQACSGINSLMSVLAFVLVWGVWQRRRAWRIFFLLPVAAIFVIAGNVARITLEAWLKVRWKIDVLEGTAHQLMGLVVFIACVGLTLSFDFLIANFIAAKPNRAALDPHASSNSARRILAREWAVAILFLATGIWSQARIGSAWAAPCCARAHFELPQTLAGWQRVLREASIVERPQTEAAESFIWQYRRGDLIASVAIDYPFAGYHELTTCYVASGWKIAERLTQRDRTVVRMSKPAGLEACLLFAGIDEAGEWVAPPPPIGANGLRKYFERAGQIGRAEPTYQVQTLLQSYGSLSRDQLSDEENLYDAGASLTNQLLAELPAHGEPR